MRTSAAQIKQWSRGHDPKPLQNLPALGTYIRSVYDKLAAGEWVELPVRLINGNIKRQLEEYGFQIEKRGSDLRWPRSCKAEYRMTVDVIP